MKTWRKVSMTLSGLLKMSFIKKSFRVSNKIKTTKSNKLKGLNKLATLFKSKILQEIIQFTKAKFSRAIHKIKLSSNSPHNYIRL